VLRAEGTGRFRNARGIVVEIGQSITGNNGNLAFYIIRSPEFDPLESNSNRANQGKEVDPGI
jgi:hypothetical protein